MQYMEEVRQRMQHPVLYMCSEMKKAVHIFRVQPPVRVASVRASDTGDGCQRAIDFLEEAAGVALVS